MTDTENNKNSNSPVLRFPGFTETGKSVDWVTIYAFLAEKAPIVLVQNLE